MKHAPGWVRTSDTVIRSPARYFWTTAPAHIIILIALIQNGLIVISHTLIIWLICHNKYIITILFAKNVNINGKLLKVWNRLISLHECMDKWTLVYIPWSVEGQLVANWCVANMGLVLYIGGDFILRLRIVLLVGMLWADVMCDMGWCVTSDIRARRKPSDWLMERRIIRRWDCSVTSWWGQLSGRSDTVQTCL